MGAIQASKISLSYTTLAEFQAALNEAVSNGQIDTFWNNLIAAKQMPLIFGNTAVFMYRGAANKVEWRGDFNYWQSSTTSQGTRQGNTDVWLNTQQFPLDARFDYKIFVDGTPMLDPLNPYQQLGGYGANSVVRMPNYVYPQITLPHDNIQPGTLNVTATITSKNLGYQVNYRVYTPAGYENLANLPTLYVTDGQDYAHNEMGGLVTALDNLLADRAIEPLVVVFIDPRDPANGQNRRDTELPPTAPNNCPFGTFVARELVPAIDAIYKTNPIADKRAILGTSYGGLHATYLGFTYADTFHLVAIQSPVYQQWSWVVNNYEASGRLPLKVFMTQGTYDYDLAGSRRLSGILQTKNYPLKYIETADGHSWGNWRGLIDDMLLYFFEATATPTATPTPTTTVTTTPPPTVTLTPTATATLPILSGGEVYLPIILKKSTNQ